MSESLLSLPKVYGQVRSLSRASRGRGYIVSCPQLPECVTQGKTVEEALEMIKDAIQGYIAPLQKHGEPIPPSLEERSPSLSKLG